MGARWQQRCTTAGSNFIGPTDVAPLIFKTKPSSTEGVGERMRLTPGGLLGIGTKTPVSRLDAKSGLPIVVQGTSTSTTWCRNPSGRARLLTDRGPAYGRIVAEVSDGIAAPAR